jgi:alpha-galactosidase/6-phospho-beta-glucosidase family protein
MSFIMNGNLHGDDLFNLLDQTLKNGLKFPEFRTSYSDVQTRNLKIGLTKMADIYRELGVLMFSSEFDGLMHLCYEESLELFAEDRQKFMAMSYDEQVKSRTRITPEKREELTKSFDKFLDQELDQDFWENYQKTDGRFGINDQHIMVKILQGLSGAEKSKVVVSRPNYGAVEGFKNRTVLEYSNYIYGKEIFPAGKYSIPDSVYGMTSALATHQTMVAEAIGEEDPKKLAQAMLAYPIRSYSKELRELCRELVKINYEEFPEKLKPVAEFF